MATDTPKIKPEDLVIPGKTLPGADALWPRDIVKLASHTLDPEQVTYVWVQIVAAPVKAGRMVAYVGVALNLEDEHGREVYPVVSFEPRHVFEIKGKAPPSMLH